MKEFKRIIGLPGLSNLGVIVEDKIFRAAQPEGYQGYRCLKEHLDVRYVLNLRRHSDRELAVSQGLLYINHPLNVWDNISIREMDEIVDTLEEVRLYPIILCCRKGQDRTGVVAACYRIRVQGWTTEEAEEEMQSYGYNDLWFMLSASLRKYVAEYRASLICAT